jgi:hypothetical protein
MCAGEEEKAEPSPTPKTPLEVELTHRLTEAVRGMCTPAVLIGPNWLRSIGSGDPPRFEYIGAIKFAKATGRPVHRVVSQLLKLVDLASLGLEAKGNTQGVITITTAKADAAAPAADAPAGTEPNEPPKSS